MTVVADGKTSAAATHASDNIQRFQSVANAVNFLPDHWTHLPVYSSSSLHRRIGVSHLSIVRDVYISSLDAFIMRPRLSIYARFVAAPVTKEPVPIDGDGDRAYDYSPGGVTVFTASQQRGAYFITLKCCVAKLSRENDIALHEQ